MNRRLVALVVIEGVVIAILGFLLLNQENQEDPTPGLTNTADAPETVQDSSGEDPGASKTESLVSPKPLHSSRYREPVAEASWSPDDPVGILLYGKVTDSEGKPVPNGYVRLRNDAGNTRRVKVEKSGAYSMTGLGPGAWDLTCSTPRYRPMELEVALDASPARRRLDLILQAAVVLRVRVSTPDGTPIGEAIAKRKIRDLGDLSVVASKTGPANDLPMTPYRAHSGLGLGTYRPAEDGTMGEIELRVDLPVHVSLVLRHAVLETKLVPEGREDVTFTVSVEQLLAKMSGIRGRVVDAVTGAPVTGVSMQLSDRQSGGGRFQSKADGTFLRENLRPGLMVFRFSSKEYANFHHYVRLVPGEIADLGTLQLHRPLEVMGKVVDPDGKGVRTTLSWRDLDRMTFPQALDVGRVTVSDDKGAFRMNVGPGRYVVRANAKGVGTANQVIQIASATDRPLIRLVRPTTVRFARKGKPTDFFLFQIVDGNGTPVWARHIWGVTSSLSAMLPAGHYKLKVFEDLRLLQTLPFTVGTKTITIDVP